MQASTELNFKIINRIFESNPALMHNACTEQNGSKRINLGCLTAFLAEQFLNAQIYSFFKQVRSKGVTKRMSSSIRIIIFLQPPILQFPPHPPILPI